MTLGSLFAGIGGFDLAARWMGWRTAWFSEIEPYASAVLKKHWPNVPNHGDITKIKGADVEPVDILCGGFPCQDISVAGKGAGIKDGTRSGLWFHYARLIDELRPKYVLAENVSALRSRGLDRVLKDLASLGYDAEWHCIPASAVGAPHRRDRVWILAYPEGDGRLEERPELGRLEERPELGRLEEGSGAEGSVWRRPLLSCEGPDVANTSSLRDQSDGVSGIIPCSQGKIEGEGDQRERRGDSADHRCEDVANPSGVRGEGMRPNRLQVIRALETEGLPDCVREGGFGGWAVEPNVGRLAHGVPSRMDRLRCDGNAVVPLVPFRIFQAIDRYERG